MCNHLPTPTYPNPTPIPRACRVYNHLLLVLDDGEFYEGHSPFTLAQVRAIVTSLNRCAASTHWTYTSTALTF